MFLILITDKSLSSCSSFVDVDFLKFTVVSFHGNRVFRINIEVCCHFAVVMLRCLDTVLSV